MIACATQLGPKRNWTDSDDLCIMFKAAYKTDFYRAVRDALHAEVDSWGTLSENGKVKSELETLWGRVNELEPVCRDADAFAFAPSESVVMFPSSTLVPVEQLVSARRM